MDSNRVWRGMRSGRDWIEQHRSLGGTNERRRGGGFVILD